MNTMQAFMRGEMARATGSPQRVFDWDTAAKYIKENGIKEASAGLIEDWGYTGGEILEDGEPVPEEDTYVFLSSNWATPYLRTDQDSFECWVYQKEKPEWNSGTYWPESALKILRGLESTVRKENEK